VSSASRRAKLTAVHAASSSASRSDVVTGNEHAVPTHTVALGAAAIVRTITVRGR